MRKLAIKICMRSANKARRAPIAHSCGEGKQLDIFVARLPAPRAIYRTTRVYLNYAARRQTANVFMRRIKYANNRTRE